MEWFIQTKVRRLFFLIALAVIGWIFISGDIIGFSVLNFFCEKLGLESPVEIASLRALLLGLPVFIGLWYFRTHDTKEQIQKSQEQIEKSDKQIKISQEQVEKSDKSINTAILSNGYNLLASPELVSRCIGVKSLVTLKRDYSTFGEQIDNVTRGLILTSKERNNQPKEPTEQQKEVINASEVANFEGADFKKINLYGAKLQGANLVAAKLVEATLNFAKLQGAQLVAADLQGAQLEGAQLQGAQLLAADLQGAQLVVVNLEGANLQRANLQGANLQGARLVGVELDGANLQGANLQGANLQAAELQSANLQAAYYDKYTLFPAYFDPKVHYMIEVDPFGNPIK